ncbi:hypothetical protein KVA01_10080 [Kocuria varians]|uniref:Uncharacterized protein n=1 Tax=Kocuria varians TaxID=1272 RepID=A0A4Y4D5M6_KOCVA|nr:hypothetical protein KVA01_10080 [Kocuria varians]
MPSPYPQVRAERGNTTADAGGPGAFAGRRRRQGTPHVLLSGVKARNGPNFCVCSVSARCAHRTLPAARGAHLPRPHSTTAPLRVSPERRRRRATPGEECPARRPSRAAWRSKRTQRPEFLRLLR